MVTDFESGDEVKMKNYILYKEERVKITEGLFTIAADGLESCWPFIKDKHFLCIHLMFDREYLIRGI